MAYRELGMVEVREILRRWLDGAGSGRLAAPSVWAARRSRPTCRWPLRWASSVGVPAQR